MKPTTERNWLSAFLRSREDFRVVRCNQCRAPMQQAEGVVPVWKCAWCKREVPRV